MKIVLASKSPRRRELLSRIISEFEIITRETDENLPRGVHPKEGVEILARRKGKAVADELPPDVLVISSDTLVELDGVALGKPVDSEDAVRTLLMLSNKIHNVHTGVAVHYKGRVFSGADSCGVKFLPIGESAAREYVKTGEPLDKAGSYAIQGIGGKFVEEYYGDFNTVVGLSLTLTQRLIQEATEND